MDKKFESWLKRVAKMDDRYSHLTDISYKDERVSFYVYYLLKYTPAQALQQEYDKYG